MAKSRLDFHDILVNILKSINEQYKNNCYFRGPSKGMKYPCIKYELDDIDIDYADNIIYNNKTKYLVTAIDTNPDSLLKNKVLELPYCRFVRTYETQGLNHFVFAIYY